jgi:hypothetical protein
LRRLEMKRITAVARRLKPNRRGPSWLQLGVAMALTLTLAVVSPAIGGPSLRSLVKQEVAKQVASVSKAKGKRGPRGPQGPAGANGANGAPGTARAYGLVTSQAFSACSPNCELSNSSGISNVTRNGVGFYCVFVPGVDAHNVSAVADVAFGPTNSPEGNTTAETSTYCSGTPAFEVITMRRTGAGDAVAADDVGFTILVP